MRKYKVSSLDEAGKFFRMILEGLANQERINVGLPGGRSIVPLLKEMSNTNQEILSKCYFYLVDERAEGDKNEQTLRDNFLDEALSSGKIKQEQLIFPKFEGDVSTDLKNYADTVPEKFDILVFGVGEDGHVAAMYPNSPLLNSEDLVVYMDDSPKPPPKRYSMTFKAFNKDAIVILLFFGDGKRDAFKSFVEGESDSCPASKFDEYENLHVITDLD